MGPRLISRGNDGTFAPCAAPTFASMGPRLISRGNVTTTDARWEEAGLQWGRD